MKRHPILLLTTLIQAARCSTPRCHTNDDCYGTCSPSGYCIDNSYESGCLSVGIPNMTVASFIGSPWGGNKRVCNSDDRALKRSECTPAQFPEYDEIRLSAANWESSLVTAWIYQILLSEVLGIPTTIETGTGIRDGKSSFYDPSGGFKYPDQVYPAEHLEEAYRHGGDCTRTSKPCSHVLPEVWAINSDIIAGRIEGIILPYMTNGVVSNLGIYVPVGTVSKDKTLASYYGLSGEENRQKLVERFKTPITWVDYCEKYSGDNCTRQTNITLRYPETEEEKLSYFAPGGLYNGHFRITENNECTTNPKCTGHIVAAPCTWSTYLESQMHWNNISLASQGPIEPNNSYSYTHMVQIYRAANATGNDVIIWWWSPELFMEEFFGTDYQFQRVTLPTPVEECLVYREQTLSAQKCSEDVNERLGDPIGACDYAYQSLLKVVSQGLKTTATKASAESRSPAFEFTERFTIPQFGLTNIFNMWYKMQRDGNVTDPARGAVCGWVKDNFDSLLISIPKGYPRSRNDVGYIVLTNAGYVVSAIAVVFVILTAAMVYMFQSHREIKAAQLNVVQSMTLGYGLVALGAIFTIVPPSNVICPLAIWLINLGYTFEHVPLLIKMSSINRLGRDARRFRKAKIDANAFKRQLAAAVLMISAYLCTWSIIDPPQRHDTFTLQSYSGADQQDNVECSVSCQSKGTFWEPIAFVWQCSLLLSTTLLTYQSREIFRHLSERHWLAALVYSQFLFLLMRMVALILKISRLVQPAAANKIIGLLLALDTIFATAIYFFPKFIATQTNTAMNDSHRNSSFNISFSNSSRGIAATDGVTRRRQTMTYITGVTIPEGGIPNLIREPANAETELEDCSLSQRRGSDALDDFPECPKRDVPDGNSADVPKNDCSVQKQDVSTENQEENSNCPDEMSTPKVVPSATNGVCLVDKEVSEEASAQDEKNHDPTYGQDEWVINQEGESPDSPVLRKNSPIRADLSKVANQALASEVNNSEDPCKSEKIEFPETSDQDALTNRNMSDEINPEKIIISPL